jgi:hypothetical protein
MLPCVTVVDAAGCVLIVITGGVVPPGCTITVATMVGTVVAPPVALTSQ